MADYNYTVKNEKPTTLEHHALKLKICGMNLNTSEVAALYPDYLGFIFWENSKRNYTEKFEAIPHQIKKVGVFVNATMEEIIDKIETFGLVAVQLHGEESPEYCQKLKEKAKNIEIIKVFSVLNEFDFSILEPYEKVCDFYLFDTKGKLPGGNGFTFDWSILKKYPSTKPYFLSGGIGLEEVNELKSFSEIPASKYCHAIDVNSKFELAPGLKDIEKLKKIKEVLK